MCGRFAFYSAAEAVAEMFAAEGAAFAPHYNLAPTDEIPVVREVDGETRRVAPLRWGLIPFWAKDRSIGNKMINARAETVAEKPAFRNAYRSRRCMILADGFYEWRAEQGGKTPHYISLESGEPFAMAGLWEDWTDKETGESVQTATIITTRANDFMAPLHQRMPVILTPTSADGWLAERAVLPDESPGLRAWPVSREVNNPRTEGPQLIVPARPETQVS